MAEFLSAGVFVEEVSSGASAVQGVSTSTFATVGWLPRGPENKAVLLGSLPDYFRTFGQYWKRSQTPLVVTSYFKAGGTRAYVVRVCPTDAFAASAAAAGLWSFKASSRGAWGNLVRVLISGNANSYDAASATYSLFDVTIQEATAGAGDFVQTEFFEGVDLLNADSASGLLTIVNDENTGSATIHVTQLAGGIPSAFTSTPVSSESVGTGAGGAQQTVTKALAAGPVAPFTLQLFDNGTLVAQDDGRGNVVGTGGVTAAGTVNYSTGALSVKFTPGIVSTHAITVDYVTKGADSVSYDLVNGADGTSVGRSQVTDPALESSSAGIYALDRVDGMMTIGLGDFRGNLTVDADGLAYCESRKNRFWLVVPALGTDPQGAVNYKRVSLASFSSYGAMYYPGVKVADPLKNGKVSVISPVGHIAGRYAFTDSNKNVGKAPAGVNDGALPFTLGLERSMSQADRDLVYPVGINPLIDTPRTGRAIWGARTLQTSGDFVYIQVRRLFMFLEQSFLNSSSDLVFESEGEELFTAITLRYGGFLNQLTSNGYFVSKNPAEAYLLICDKTNNPQSVRDAGQLICDVLVAPQTPAEFIRFRFQRAVNKLG